MLLYLNGLESEKGAPNENYARELMELFTLGHGSGYTERDVREQARALTGFTATYRNGYGWVKFRFDRNRHDDAMKVVFDKPGAVRVEAGGHADDLASCPQDVLHPKALGLLHP